MRVFFSLQVRSYLRAEKRYLGKHSTSAGKQLAKQVHEARRLLSEFPLTGASWPLAGSQGLRRLVVRPYVLYYECDGEQVNVVHIRHGRQLEPDTLDIADFDFEE